MRVQWREKRFFLNSAEGCLLLEHFKHVLLTCGVNGEIGLSTTFNVAPSDNKTTYKEDKNVCHASQKEF